MLASLFRAISDRQNSLRWSGFSRTSNCQRTRCGLAEYPDAPATQTISPFQSIRIRLTFCSASHDRTSNETLPLPSIRIIRSGNDKSPRKYRNVSRSCGWWANPFWIVSAPFSMRYDTPCPARVKQARVWPAWCAAPTPFQRGLDHMLERDAQWVSGRRCFRYWGRA